MTGPELMGWVLTCLMTTPVLIASFVVPFILGLLWLAYKWDTTK